MFEGLVMQIYNRTDSVLLSSRHTGVTSLGFFSSKLITYKEALLIVGKNKGRTAVEVS